MEIREMEENPGREQETGLEERFAAIEEILDAMEKPEATLEQSFALYQQGLKELNVANSMLDDMEKAMLVMMEDGSLEEF
ncbi:MAG: exodeoxyribonuclease VII small subunit [Blautia sp.]|nr:exodeoxyribonuclease VII small subunit [Blautia sp.]